MRRTFWPAPGRQSPQRPFYEFFAGGGMVRLGLGPEWQCVFANDIDPMKAGTYARNFGDEHLHLADIGTLTASDLPGRAELAWASFPCQDLSLAGKGAGLEGQRSGMFWAFWSLMEALQDEGRAPNIIALENVTGLLSSRQGHDFAAIGEAFANLGYLFGALIIDAAHFVPQSRPRLFVVGVRSGRTLPHSCILEEPDPVFHPARLRTAVAGLGPFASRYWRWWRLDAPAARNSTFADLIEDSPSDVTWHGLEETRRLLQMMTPHNLAKVQAALAQTSKRRVGAIYKRTRVDTDGVKHQRAEVRYDDIAGCLRTPGGGSSRQAIIVSHGGKIRTRLLSAREAARLMGLPDDYKLPERYNDAYHVAGDGVAPPVVKFLSQSLFAKLLAAQSVRKSA